MTAPETEGQTPRTCWRGECREVCYYPDVCSGVAPASVTGVALTAEEREALRAYFDAPVDFHATDDDVFDGWCVVVARLLAARPAPASAATTTETVE